MKNLMCKIFSDEIIELSTEEKLNKKPHTLSRADAQRKKGMKREVLNKFKSMEYYC